MLWAIWSTSDCLPGQTHNLRGAAALIDGLTCGHFLADRAVDANWLGDALTEAGIVPIIPPKSNRRFPANVDRDTYKWRHLIENFFGKIEEYRGIAMRCCKTDTSFKAFISIAATVIRLKRTSTRPKKHQNCRVFAKIPPSSRQLSARGGKYPADRPCPRLAHPDWHP